MIFAVRIVAEHLPAKVVACARFAGIAAGVSVIAAGLSALGSSESSAQSYTKKYKPAPSFSIFDDYKPYQPPKAYRTYGAPRARATGERSNSKSAKSKEAAPAEEPVKGPLVLTVSIAKQKVTVHDIDGPIAEAPISSGQAAFPTLTGVFSILEKSVVHHSNLYGDAPMPYMERLTWSGTAMHAGDLPGYPASHGCIRLPYNFSKKLYGLTKLGTRVIVTRDPITPVPISHPHLIAPLPPDEIANAGAGTIASAALPAKIADQIDYESVRSIGIVTAALAEPAPAPAAPASTYRSAFRAAIAAQRTRLDEAVSSATAGKLEAETRAKAAAKAADSVKAEAQRAKIEADRLDQAAKKTEQAWQSSDRELVAMSKKYASQGDLTADVVEKLRRTEDTLEDKTIGLQDATEAARVTAERAVIARAATESNIAVAAKEVRSAAQSLAKVNLELKMAQLQLGNFRRQQAMRKHPVSVFISRATKRLYVRQGYEPMYDIPITIKDPDAAIGTHVFTALEFTNNQTDMRWSVASIPYSTEVPVDPKKRNRNADKDNRPASTRLPQNAKSALDRVTIPDDVREKIADVMKPGSSIIVSDYGLSYQTGLFTDFIILTR